MDAQNRTLLKGGLPMSSSDFVDPSKAKESKLKILAALQHITEIHERQMSPGDNAEPLNKAAVNNTIDMANQEAFKMDDYVFSNQILHGDERDIPKGEPLFTIDTPQETPAFEQMDDLDATYANNQPMEIEDNTQSNDLNNMVPNQGQPMFVLSDDEIGKRKKHNKTKDGKQKVTASADDIKSGKKVAWLSYILFFIPLLFMRKNAFVRHHANEGLELNIIDILGIALFLVPNYIKSTNQYIIHLLPIAKIVGIVLVAVSLLTKLFLIIFSLAGKEASSPWFGNPKIIK